MATGVEFDEDKMKYRRSAGGGQMPGSSGSYGDVPEKGLTAWLLRHHIASSPKAAQGILIAIAIIDVIIMYVVIKYFI
jgi:hypothetical protein